ncbi:hypothetical protein [Caballeronia sp. dw_19]|jgi:hypothetical protein|uniref:hypothetical protein n=1 Tax=Caballeronia sp. dw_19 TaxID=2719791 RepID=UPI001BD66362|nr:hypothetical protein [Caballeronia sp. dw_19]
MTSSTYLDDRERMRLRHDPVGSSAEAAPAPGEVFLYATLDGKTIVLIEPEERFSDHHATGPEQEVRHEISVSELIQLIRAHGARL